MPRSAASRRAFLAIYVGPAALGNAVCAFPRPGIILQKRFRMAILTRRFVFLFAWSTQRGCLALQSSRPLPRAACPFRRKARPDKDQHSTGTTTDWTAASGRPQSRCSQCRPGRPATGHWMAAADRTPRPWTDGVPVSAAGRPVSVAGRPGRHWDICFAGVQTPLSQSVVVPVLVLVLVLVVPSAERGQLHAAADAMTAMASSHACVLHATRRQMPRQMGHANRFCRIYAWPWKSTNGRSPARPARRRSPEKHAGLSTSTASRDTAAVAAIPRRHMRKGVHPCPGGHHPGHIFVGHAAKRRRKFLRHSRFANTV